jgi:hypothetical protein
MNAKTRDLLGSVLMLAFVAILWVQRHYITPFGGIFPDIVMIGLTALALLTIALAFTPWRAIKEEKEADKKASPPRHWFAMATVAAAMLAWTLLLRTLGFALAGVLGFGGIAWFLSERRSSPRTLITSFAIGAALTFLLIFVFDRLLQVPLPKGTLFG